MHLLGDGMKWNVCFNVDFTKGKGRHMKSYTNYLGKLMKCGEM